MLTPSSAYVACARLVGCPFESHPAQHRTSRLPSLVAGTLRFAPGASDSLAPSSPAAKPPAVTGRSPVARGTVSLAARGTFGPSRFAALRAARRGAGRERSSRLKPAHSAGDATASFIYKRLSPSLSSF